MSLIEPISPQTVIDLVLALKDAETDYQKAIKIQMVPQLETVLEVLPVCFGRLLSSLDLIDTFTRMGRTVRSFADAQETLLKLMFVINNKLDIIQPEETKIQIARLFQLCDDVALIQAALANPSSLIYPDDFLPGGSPFSDN